MMVTSPKLAILVDIISALLLLLWPLIACDFQTTSIACDCMPETAITMKIYRQCQMRANRHSLFKHLSEEAFNRMLTEASSECNMDDICVSNRQAMDMLSLCPRKERRQKVGIARDILTSSWKWPKHTLTYSVWPEFSGTEKMELDAAFSEYSQRTCLNFIKVAYGTNEDLQVVNAKGCSSYIGYIFERPQKIFLEKDTFCFRHGVLMHEIGHALGLIHEHQRPDRDEYVRVKLENLQNENLASNFFLYPYVIKTGPYDYTSTMHYGKDAGAKDNKLTLVTKDIRYQNTIGQSAELSFYDLQSVNLRYCQSSCGTVPNDCLHLGYKDPTDCSKCVCQSFFAGPRCAQLRLSFPVSVCLSTQEFNVTPGDTLVFHVRNYIQQDTRCIWRISTSYSYRIRISHNGQFQVGHTDSCVSHWLEIRDEAEEDQIGLRFCGLNAPDGWKSRGTSFLMMFFVYNDRRAPDPDPILGFSLNFTAEPIDNCGIPDLIIKNSYNDIGDRVDWAVTEVITYTCVDGFHVKDGVNSFSIKCIRSTENPDLLMWSAGNATCQGLMDPACDHPGILRPCTEDKTCVLVEGTFVCMKDCADFQCTPIFQIPRLFIIFVMVPVVIIIAIIVGLVYRQSRQLSHRSPGPSSHKLSTATAYNRGYFNPSLGSYPVWDIHVPNHV